MARGGARPGAGRKRLHDWDLVMKLHAMRMTYAQIAERIGGTPGSVGTIIKRARKKQQCTS